MPAPRESRSPALHTSEIARPHRTWGPFAAIGVLAAVLLASLGCGSGTSGCAESVTFGERPYVGTEIQQEDAAVLEGIVPERAFSAAGATWVADGECYEGTPGSLASCLTSAD